jgi:hypothetical protein
MKLLILNFLFFHAVKAQENDCPLQSEVSLLNNGGLTMSHVMNPIDDTLTVELVYEGEGWLGFGFSSNGRMIGSSAVIGLPDKPLGPTNPGKYSLWDHTVGSVRLMSDEEQTLTDTSITQNATHTTMKFTKHLVEDGELAIDAYGENTFIYATGIVNALSPHSQDGAFTTKLTNCSTSSNNILSDPNGDFFFLDSVRSTRKLWMWHGVLMAVAWGILTPLAIGSSLLRDTVCLQPGVWLTIHLSLNMFAILCMVVSFGIAVYATNEKTADGEDPKHFVDTKHKTIGLVIFLLAFVQAIIGMLRPHGPKKPATPVEVPEDVERAAEMNVEMAIASSDKLGRTERTQHSQNGSDDSVSKSGSVVSGKSITRRIWEFKHRIMGLSLLGLSWYNCDAGLELYAERYGEDNDLSVAFWDVTGGLAGLIFILYAVQIARR